MDTSLLTRRFRKTILPEYPAEIEAGSPLRRAKELDIPVQVFHGDHDLNVPVEQSRQMEDALDKAEKDVDYMEFEDTDHYIR